MNKQEYIDNITKDINNDKKFLKQRSNGLLLSDDHIEILNRNGIDYQKFSSLSSLIYEIETYLSEEENEELDLLEQELSERNYYQNTNK